ncbi:hypothetical protein BH09ACT7_BH09ACT7_28990 [soil metagenome]
MQICNRDEDVCGTGFLIGSSPWRVITCEHVASVAGVPRTADAEQRLLVRFPEAKPPEVRDARVVGRLDTWDDDVVILELDSPEPPVLPEYVLTLTPAHDPDDHPFKSYGFRDLDEYQWGLASGSIEGAIPPPEGRYLFDRLQLKSQHITDGMSGAPVLDMESKQVVGIVCESFQPKPGVDVDRDTAWAVDGRILGSFPESAQPRPSALPEISGPDIGSALAPSRAPSGWLLEGAPALRTAFVGREAEIAWLTERWKDPTCPVVFVVGLGGQGKTALVSRWVDTLKSADAPAALFWWGFGAVPSVDEFFTAALDYFSGGEASPSLRSGPARSLMLAAYLAAGRSLLVLDDIDALGAADSGASREIARLLATLTDQDEAKCMCMVTARTPPIGVDAQVLDLPSLDEHSAAELLFNSGVEYFRASDIASSVRVPLAVDLIGHHQSVATDFAVRNRGEKPDELVRQLVSIARAELSEDAGNLLRVVCLLRRPVPLTWSESLARVALSALDAIIPYPDAALEELLTLGFLQATVDESRGGVLVHQAIRATFADDLGDRRNAVHLALSDMWWERRQRNEDTGESERRPAKALIELRPAIEAVHHMCAAGRPDDAFLRLSEGIYRGRSFALANQLGEWAIDFEIIREFFPHGDIRRPPTVEDAAKASILLNEAALDLRMLGRPGESLPLFERAAEVARGEPEFLAVAALARQSETLVELGQLRHAEDVAQSALQRAAQAGDQQTTWYSHGTLAWAIALQGRLDEALEHYRLATEIRAPGLLEGPIALGYMLTLWWARRAADANEVLAQTGKLAEGEGDRDALAQLTRVRGEMAASTGEDPDAAIEELRVAAELASNLTAPQPRIQALTSLGAAITAFAGAASYGLDEAGHILNEALRLTAASGMRFFEPAVRIGLAHLSLRQGEDAEANEHIARAEALAAEFGNAWDLARLQRLKREWTRLQMYALAPA